METETEQRKEESVEERRTILFYSSFAHEYFRAWVELTFHILSFVIIIIIMFELFMISVNILSRYFLYAILIVCDRDRERERETERENERERERVKERER